MGTLPGYRLPHLFAPALVLITLLLNLNVGCVDRSMHHPGAPQSYNCSPAPDPWRSSERSVDILFVIDNSGSMWEKQALLQEQLWALFDELRAAYSGMPDLHIGVTSTDLGTNPYPIAYCETPGGDNGKLLMGACHHSVSPSTGAPFIRDVEPLGCEILKDQDGRCIEHNCQVSNCNSITDATLIEDRLTGCPRCRNFLGEELEEVLGCMTSLGTTGCGFEQPLEAMLKALDNSTMVNGNFLRENSILTVIFLTDEDDCSAGNPHLFDNTQDSMDSQLGPLTSFRCFEFGILCNENDREHQGTRTGCGPREDSEALLYPVSRYIDFLSGLRNPERLVVSAIAGPVGDLSVTIGSDDYHQPRLMPSCESVHGSADPAIRLQAVVHALTPPEDQDAAFTSICSSSFQEALRGLGQRIRSLIIPPYEHICDDGIDNDEDGLVDLDDPDCQG